MLFLLVSLLAVCLYPILTVNRLKQSNIVLVGDKLRILSIDGINKKVTVVVIPDDAYIMTAYGKGRVLASALMKFDRRFSNNLLQVTLSEYLGIPIDGYIASGDYRNISEENLQKFIAADFFPLKFRQNSQKLISFLRVGIILNEIRPDKFLLIDLTNSGVYQETVLADQSRVMVGDMEKLDNVLFEKFHERQILKENMSVSVLNGSKKAGLATGAARILNNIGVNVVNVSESRDRFVKCEIQTNSSQNNYTLSRLRQIFGCEVKFNVLASDRADIVLILGDDYAIRMFGRV